MSSIELFAGAGGLAMGIAHAGFNHSAVVEWKADACQTIKENIHHYGLGKAPFDLHCGDVRGFNLEPYVGQVELVSGGPPCQPFSLGGKHKGNMDERDMFPAAVHAVHVTKPKAFIFENVKGLLRVTFADYFEYIVLQLSHPDVTRRTTETWEAHHKRLVKLHSSGRHPAAYDVRFRLLNAADYGVPQKRERVFLVGFRADLGSSWSPPEPTHSEDSLHISKWITGEYWDRHKVSKSERPQLSEGMRRRIERLRTQSAGGYKHLAPWVTVRDALAGLPDPEFATRKLFANHEFNAGARSYAGHTGSPLDEPAKTLKAGDHGVPGGENMLVKSDGSVRYFSVREAARLQTFPDSYVFHGSWSDTMKQLGNAVPVRLAHAVADSVAKTLSLKA